MVEIDINYELKHVSGILSDVETLDLPWSDQELAGFDWYMAVWAVKRLYAVHENMNESQIEQFNSLRARMDTVKDKLKLLELENPFDNL